MQNFTHTHCFLKLADMGLNLHKTLNNCWESTQRFMVAKLRL